MRRWAAASWGCSACADISTCTALQQNSAPVAIKVWERLEASALHTTGPCGAGVWAPRPGASLLLPAAAHTCAAVKDAAFARLRAVLALGNCGCSLTGSCATAAGARPPPAWPPAHLLAPPHGALLHLQAWQVAVVQTYSIALVVRLLVELVLAPWHLQQRRLVQCWAGAHRLEATCRDASQGSARPRKAPTWHLQAAQVTAGQPRVWGPKVADVCRQRGQPRQALT